MEVEFGKCKYCEYEGPINRTYYRYDIRCECHSPQHFEMVYHCDKCEPKEPQETKITINTKILRQLSDIKRATINTLKQEL